MWMVIPDARAMPNIDNPIPPTLPRVAEIRFGSTKLLCRNGSTGWSLWTMRGVWRYHTAGSKGGYRAWRVHRFLCWWSRTNRLLA